MYLNYNTVSIFTAKHPLRDVQHVQRGNLVVTPLVFTINQDDLADIETYNLSPIKNIMSKMRLIP